MGLDRTLDLVCVSYLADTQLLRVTSYPPPNGGAVVNDLANALAADGPIAAMTAARLGLRVGLIANAVGSDAAGQRMLDRLALDGIRHTIAVIDITTPQMTVIADDSGARTWFARLQQACDDLRSVNLHLLTDARLVYVDCYQVLTPAAVRAVAAARAPLLLNLGGDPLDERIAAAAADQQVTAVQTSLDEADAADAEALATDLLARLHPAAAVVTLGRLGAIACTASGIHRAAAPPVAVAHTHGAGAAFSAGYAHAWLNGADIGAALNAACHAGATHCANSATVPLGRTTTALAAS